MEEHSSVHAYLDKLFETRAGVRQSVQRSVVLVLVAFSFAGTVDRVPDMGQPGVSA